MLQSQSLGTDGFFFPGFGVPGLIEVENIELEISNDIIDLEVIDALLSVDIVDDNIILQGEPSILELTVLDDTVELNISSGD